MSQLYVAVLAVIVVALLAVAIYRTTQVKTKADYLVAGRSLPAFVILFAYIGITSYQFKGGGNVLHLIFSRGYFDLLQTLPRNSHWV
jgi:Na+/proline symporter